MIAIYPGRFDPVTLGHLSVARRASGFCDRLIIAVFDNPAKPGLFTAAERVDLIKQSVKDLPNVEVHSFSGLMVNFARRMGVSLIIRGLRVGADFEREMEMYVMNRRLDEGIELCCLFSEPQYQYLSASLIKEVVMLGGDSNGLISEHVADALKNKLASA
ncbi:MULTISPECIES: pantetheine-phosphate adenylyltransferase [Dehalococcoides]|uniref:Phosphopantetheine adenylyltransferase n=1 Tax=Dehalococcoides mccartyi TaxID=61435 RepID=A0AB38Z7K9_9CHLR|nr:pantetheine-phosphate adenylyltransferase [Dehalococcoides mccartyi]WRO06568.1 pantetheine-phosphate adenylyltransferase [Dehalococcoides mccartyi]